MRWSEPPPQSRNEQPHKPHPLKGKPRAPIVTPSEIHEMRRLKMSGMLIKEIAQMLRRSYTAVQVIVTDLTKATRNQADQKRAVIRQLRERGATFNEITKATGAKKTEIQWAIKKTARIEKAKR
jgi:DNA-binding transcriptional MerR regulator